MLLFVLYSLFFVSVNQWICHSATTEFHWMDNVSNDRLDDSSLLKKAQHARNRGDYKTAYEIKDILLAKDPSVPYWHSLAAALYTDHEEFELAAEERKQTAMLMANGPNGYKPHIAEEWASYAVQLINLNRFSDAIDAIDTSYHVLMNNNAYIYRAQAYLKWRLFETVDRRKDGGGVDSYMFDVISKDEEERENIVIGLFELAIKDVDDRLRSSMRSSLALYYYYIQKWDKSLQLYDVISNDSEYYTTYKGYYMKGRIYCEMGELDLCEENLLRSLKERHRYREAYLEYLFYLVDNRRGVGLVGDLEWEIITEAYSDTFDSDWNSKFFTLLAHYYSMNNKLDKATFYFEKIVLPTLQNKFYYFSYFGLDRVYYYLSLHYIRCNKYELAIKYLSIIINDMRPKWAQAHLLLSQCLIKTNNNVNLGLKHFEIAMKLNKYVTLSNVNNKLNIDFNSSTAQSHQTTERTTQTNKETCSKRTVTSHTDPTISKMFEVFVVCAGIIGIVSVIMFVSYLQKLQYLDDEHQKGMKKLLELYKQENSSKHEKNQENDKITCSNDGGDGGNSGSSDDGNESECDEITSNIVTDGGENSDTAKGTVNGEE